MSKAENIDEYIAAFPADVQKKLGEIREAIKQAAPKAEETINYAIPTFKLNGNLVHFAGLARHVGFYPGPDGIEVFAEELTGYRTSKGTIQFPHDAKLPVGLIKRIVKFRVKQNLEKKK